MVGRYETPSRFVTYTAGRRPNPTPIHRNAGSSPRNDEAVCAQQGDGVSASRKNNKHISKLFNNIVNCDLQSTIVISYLITTQNLKKSFVIVNNIKIQQTEQQRERSKAVRQRNDTSTKRNDLTRNTYE